jgi:hypothetical protein
MTPEYLACTTSNTQLEPIRRAIDCAVPAASSPNSDVQPVELGYQTTYDQFGRHIRPVRTNTSLDNPFLRLTQEEYRTLRYLSFYVTLNRFTRKCKSFVSRRRYQEERHLPDRFLGQTAAQDNMLYQRKEAPPANPSFQTTAQEYGKYHPNIHTMPYSYHGLSTKFTAKKTEFGNYRNHSLNI